jgi:hypothetical protein
MSSEQVTNQIITDIKNLQEIETELFTHLDANVVNNTLTPEQKDNIIKQINDISNMRVNLYNTLNQLNVHYHGEVETNNNLLNGQMLTIHIIEKELNETKKKYEMLKQDKVNKMRFVEINKYYSDLYANKISILKFIIYMFVDLILLFLLKRWLPLIFPDFLFYTLVIIVIAACMFLILFNVVQNYSRDNMNFNRYEFQAPTGVSIDTNNPTGTNPWAPETNDTATCIGQNCCDTGYTYVPLPTNKCVINANLPVDVKPFVE